MQRVDSALLLDPHCYALVLGGVYTGLENGGEVVVHPLPKPSGTDIEKPVRSLHKRITSLLRKRGELDDDECE